MKAICKSAVCEVIHAHYGAQKSFIMYEFPVYIENLKLPPHLAPVIGFPCLLMLLTSCGAVTGDTNASVLLLLKQERTPAAARDSIFRLRDLRLTLLERKRWNGFFNHLYIRQLNISVVHRNRLKILFADTSPFFKKSYDQGINFIGWKFSGQVFGRVWKSLNSYSLCCKRVQFDIRTNFKPVYYEIGLEPKWSTNFAAVEEDNFVCVAILRTG